MGHQPYESWLISEEPLLPEDELKLHEHIASCDTCRQLSYSWSEVQDMFQEPQFASPSPGFTGRWQSRLVEFQLLETERKQKRISWMFFAAMAGAAAILLGFMAVRAARRPDEVPYITRRCRRLRLIAACHQCERQNKGCVYREF